MYRRGDHPFVGQLFVVGMDALVKLLIFSVVMVIAPFATYQISMAGSFDGRLDLCLTTAFREYGAGNRGELNRTLV